MAKKQAEIVHGGNAQPGADAPAAIEPRVFRHTVDQADTAISITDVHGNILYVNPAFSRVTGYAAGEAIGRNESILSNKTTPPGVYKALWQSISRGEAWGGRLVNRRKDGSKYLAEISISPVVDGGGEVINYLGMHRDITEMHRLECEVKNQKALIESVVDAAPMVIAVLDVDDRVVLDNQEYKKLQADLGMAEPAPMLMTAIRAGLELDTVKGRRNSGYVFLDREVRLDLSGGKAPRWFSCSGSPLHEDDSGADAFFAGGGRNYLLLVAKEITGLRAEQEKGRVAALQVVMSEEDRVSALRESLSAATFRLEGPLNMMASVVAMLARRNGEADPMAVALADTMASGQQALAELRAMIPAETREPSGAINVNELLRDVLDLSTRRLLAAGISVNWKPQAMLPTLQGYPNKLRGLFKALIDNAIEAMSTRGWRERELGVITRAQVGGIEIVIEDSGPGIPRAQQLKVFEPFYTTKREGGGQPGHLGTGLSAAQQTAADHGGTIEIDPDKATGCRVHVLLPVKRRS
ncbi:MAG: nitrogen fixation negative regulator NifL [Sulfuritalea sp.]|nr:nitrogen fixation negative regulator NifL [Sulfuritalea sp.]MDP1983358.1 nitrogen fixation negative regulator NifL [Sulfuritalea sp.]